MNYVVGLDEIEQSQVAEVGGKGANLGELSRIDGVRVPPGFCVTADAFREIVAAAPSLDGVLERLRGPRPDDREAIGAISAEARGVIEEIPLPDDLVAAVGAALARLGEHAAYAVRSSATAEDLPTASFAGQQDSYLNVVGVTAILEHVRRCWASLFTERAVTYRRRNGFDHRRVHMAVVVQAMVFPAGGRDPLHRRSRDLQPSGRHRGRPWGLGEALVSGVVSGDVYTVRDDEVVAKIGRRQAARRRGPAPRRHPNDDGRAGAAAASGADGRAGRAARAAGQADRSALRPSAGHRVVPGRRRLRLVQSRPITTLFPVPVTDDGENHVYVSVGHQQMMTDAMKPLGLALWQMTTPRPMAEAGGRLFVDVAAILASPTSRARMLDLARSDPLIGDALQTVVDRGDFLPPPPDEAPAVAPPGGEQAPIDADPALVVEFIERSRASLAALERDIATMSGPELFDFIRGDIGELRRVLFDPRSLQVIMAGMEATWWLNEHLQEWLGEKNVADTLTQSVPHNVTSEMGFALLDVADVIRPHPDVVEFLQQVELAGCADDGFLDELAAVAGGPAARDAIRTFLDEYGMRCPGEIDITRPRWSERPAMLVSTILGNVRNHEPGAGKRLFERGRQQAWEKEADCWNASWPCRTGNRRPTRPSG